MTTERRCPTCGGTLSPGFTTVCRTDGARTMIFERVPARVCDQCGEALIRAGLVEAIDRIWDASPPPPPARTTEAFVYDMSADPSAISRLSAPAGNP